MGLVCYSRSRRFAVGTGDKGKLNQFARCFEMDVITETVHYCCSPCDADAHLRDVKYLGNADMHMQIRNEDSICKADIIETTESVRTWLSTEFSSDSGNERHAVEDSESSLGKRVKHLEKLWEKRRSNTLKRRKAFWKNLRFETWKLIPHPKAGGVDH